MEFLQCYENILKISALVLIVQVVLLHVHRWRPSLRKINLLLCKTKNLAAKLHKPIIKKIEKRKVYSSFKDNI